MTAPDDLPASGPERARNGDWAVVRAACLEGARSDTGRTALVLEPARRSDIALCSYACTG